MVKRRDFLKGVLLFPLTEVTKKFISAKGLVWITENCMPFQRVLLGIPIAVNNSVLRIYAREGRGGRIVYSRKFKNPSPVFRFEVPHLIETYEDRTFFFYAELLVDNKVKARTLTPLKLQYKRFRFGL